MLNISHKWNGDPYPPTLLPWCPAFSTLNTRVATSAAWPAFVQHILNPAVISPGTEAITDLNCRAHFSSIWTVFLAQEVSYFSPGGICLDNHCHKTSQIVPWRLGPMWEHHWAAWSRQKLEMWFSRRKCSPSIDWQSFSSVLKALPPFLLPVRVPCADNFPKLWK